MGKPLEPLEIQITKDGNIALIQGSGLDPDCSAVVRITPDQVEELFYRLQEAKEKLTKKPPIVRSVMKQRSKIEKRER